MQQDLFGRRSAALRVAAFAVPAVVLTAIFRRPALHVAGLALGGTLIAFLAAPLAAALEKRMKRPLAALCALLILAGCLAALLLTLLPPMVRQLIQLAQTVPETLDWLTRGTQALGAWIEARLPGLRLPDLFPSGLPGSLTDIAAGTIQLAGSAGEAISTLSLAAMLAYFFLCDRARLLLRLELMIPLSFRQTAVRMGSAVCRELRLYLCGQLLIAAAVGTLAALGLMVAGVESALILGAVVGLLNMIPYFGPFIGGVPAVLIALSGGWQRAALTAGVLALVQQLDAAIISPRIMGSLTGFSPAAVLLAISGGAKLAGIVGMLTALPVLMSIRTVFRVFVQSRENI